MTSRRARALWSIGDQGLASSSNFLLMLMVVRTSSTGEIGAFGLAYTTFFMLQALGRAIASEPFTIRYASSTELEQDLQSGRALGATLVLSVPVALVIVAIGLAVGGAVGSAFTSMAALLPLLLLQDALRLLYFATARPKSACINDFLFLVLQIGIYTAIAASESLSVPSLFLGWGAAAGLAGAIGLAIEGWRPRISHAKQWLADHRDLAPAFAGDYLVNRGADQLTSVIISALAGLSALGSVTAARLLYAPMNTLQTGINAFALPEVAKLNLLSRRDELLRLVHFLALGTGAVLAVGAVGASLLPSATGRALLGDQWAVVRPLVPEAGCFYVMNAVANGLWIGLRGLGRAKETLAIRTVAAILMLGLTGIGASVEGSSGALWGMTFATTCLAMALYWQFRRSLVELVETGQHHKSDYGPST